ncbi:polysaccharide biosynthesis tyrosine autokinase [Microlunatus flavus]|uniref:Capsular exopolysaccharide family n=1 Tax=Microlunatus flavus TaxID=1036181 RepID=A0A1H8ZB96_9ACTN|nr:polysaccharide biosynthesis tyrosine autokinase [Microlunatus flavus]SEP61653.1 capsular exopolysaccharide family [Microlunatus flavus]
MELRAYVNALRVRWVLVAALAVLGALLGLVAYVLTPTVHASSLTFYVSVPPAAGGSSATATQYAQAKVNSYVSLVRSDEAARRVIADQGLPLTPSAVSSMISASAQQNSQLISVSVRDESAARTLAVARGLADTFGPLVDELDNQGRPSDVIGIDVVSGPTQASAPVGPDLKRYLVLGLLAGLVLGALLAVLRDLLDTTVRSAGRAAELVGAPTLAVVDEDPDAAARAEPVRQLRTGLAFLRAAGGREPGAEVVVVTSALGGEGKTTTSLDLARATAESGEQVLLVEADLRRPTLAGALNLGAGPGLSEVLAGQAPLSAAVRPTGTDGLWVLPAGALPPNPAELLGSARAVELVAGLRGSYGRVLLDSPPLLPVTDAALAAGLADGVLVVVRWGRSRADDVREAVGMLEQVHARVLGVVLNGRRLSRGERRRYAAYLGHGPGQGAGHEHSWGTSKPVGG